jgi:predicted permease
MPFWRQRINELNFDTTIKITIFEKKRTSMEGFMIFPILIVLFYLTIIAAVFYLVYTWVTKFISLKEEQNNLLREIIKRMENK